jgi:hypothetical protein
MMILLWNSEVFNDNINGKMGMDVYEDLIKMALKSE